VGTREDRGVVLSGLPAFSGAAAKSAILYVILFLQKEVVPMLLKKPWGVIKAITLNQPCTVKLITVEPGQETSLHYHKLRDDVWVILDDGLEVTIGDDVYYPREGDEFTVPAEQKHKIRSLGKRGRVLEIDIGFTSEDDTFRLSDPYGRETKEKEEFPLE
jgi:mannose-1-phosphate guanylyltransferase/mannose-6-phosphate isomerase/mannose-1-phosphate guanylyltransferase/mannose-6-phosphate isomerase